MNMFKILNTLITDEKDIIYNKDEELIFTKEIRKLIKELNLKKDKNKYKKLQEFFTNKGWGMEGLNNLMESQNEGIEHYCNIVYKIKDIKGLYKYPSPTFVYYLIKNFHKVGYYDLSIYYNSNLERFEYWIANSLNSLSIEVYLKDNYEVKYEFFSKGKSLFEGKEIFNYNTQDNELYKAIINEYHNINKNYNKGKKYYTKCGREFLKGSISSTTGYEYPKLCPECVICPFKEVISRYKQGEEVNFYECRAGEKEPNHRNDYYTSNMDNFTHLSLYSIDFKWLEDIRREVENVEGITSAYYTQDLCDCRKVLTIGFKQNKLGIKAKKELIEKYFKKIGAKF